MYNILYFLLRRKESSVMSAASHGATMAISIVQGIVANLIAVVSFIAFLNALLGWFGGLVGWPDLSLELVCGWLFVPLAWLIGVEWDDCGHIGRVIATKTMINEFVAYKKLGKLKTKGSISVRDVNFK